MSPSLRRTVTVLMSAAVLLMVAALVMVGVIYSRQAKAARAREAVAVAQRERVLAALDASTRTIQAQLDSQNAATADRAKTLNAAIEAVNAELRRTVERLFAQASADQKAQAARLRAEILRAQSDLANRIAGIVSGPAGPRGPAGPPGPSPTPCLLLCR